MYWLDECAPRKEARQQEDQADDPRWSPQLGSHCRLALGPSPSFSSPKMEIIQGLYGIFIKRLLGFMYGVLTSIKGLMVSIRCYMGVSSEVVGGCWDVEPF